MVLAIQNDLQATFGFITTLTNVNWEHLGINKSPRSRDNALWISKVLVDFPKYSLGAFSRPTQPLTLLWSIKEIILPYTVLLGALKREIQRWKNYEQFQHGMINHNFSFNFLTILPATLGYSKNTGHFWTPREGFPTEWKIKPNGVDGLQLRSKWNHCSLGIRLDIKAPSPINATSLRRVASFHPQKSVHCILFNFKSQSTDNTQIPKKWAVNTRRGFPNRLKIETKRKKTSCRLWFFGIVTASEFNPSWKAVAPK